MLPGPDRKRRTQHQDRPENIPTKRTSIIQLVSDNYLLRETSHTENKHHTGLLLWCGEGCLGLDCWLLVDGIFDQNESIHFMFAVCELWHLQRCCISHELLNHMEGYFSHSIGRGQWVRARQPRRRQLTSCCMPCTSNLLSWIAGHLWCDGRLCARMSFSPEAAVSSGATHPVVRTITHPFLPSLVFP